VAAHDRIPFARFAQFERTRRPMKEGNANTSFKKGKRSAHRSRRFSQLTPGLPQATLVKDRNEDLHGVDPVHLTTVWNFISKRHADCGGPAHRNYPQASPLTSMTAFAKS
jgi:hypothetical protein